MPARPARLARAIRLTVRSRLTELRRQELDDGTAARAMWDEWFRTCELITKGLTGMFSGALWGALEEE
jgi:hypothetical protein